MTTLSSKFNIPPCRYNFVLRQRLIKKLQYGLNRKLTLISAPAGYGKTTLVGEWIPQSGRHVAWLSLEEGDAETLQFLTNVILSLQTITGTIGKGALELLQSPEALPIHSIIESLLSETTIMPSFMLVLDDYHVMKSQHIDEAISFIVDHLPTHIHLVLITREDPSIPLARLRAQDQLTELREADLRFTPSEVEEFLNEIMQLNLPKDKLAELASRTEGWITGLQLAGLSIQGDRGTDRFIQSIAGNHHFVLDYLVEEVLERQPEAVQSFLIRTSILNRMCGSLCNAVLLDPGIPSGQQLLDLERQNLFVISLDHERRWYRYHHLFAESLQRRLEDHLDGTHIAELHKRASSWYENHGFEIEAFHHAAKSGDIDRTACLLEGGKMPLHLRGAAGISLKWLESLPASELDARPALWVMYGSVLLISGKPSQVELKLKAAEAALEGLEQDVRVRDLIGLIAATRAAVSSLKMSVNSTWTNQKLQAAEKVMQRTEQDDKSHNLIELIAPERDVSERTTHETDQVIYESRRALEYLRQDNLPVRTSAAWMLGVSSQRRGDNEGARKAYNEVISYSHVMGHKLMAIMSLIGLGQLHEAEDEPNLAEECYEEAILLTGDLPLPALHEAQAGLERARRILLSDMKNNLVEKLSPRELEVLMLIAKGLSNRDIGEKLFLAMDTVKGHNRRIFEKLQVRRRTEAIARAQELNLLPSPYKPH